MLNLPALPSRVTHAEAVACLAQCEAALDRAQPGDTAVVDAGALEAFDSSVLSVMLAVRRAALARQLTLQVRDLPVRLRELATLYGVGELLPG